MEMQSPSNLFVSELPEAPIPPPDSADSTLNIHSHLPSSFPMSFAIPLLQTASISFFSLCFQAYFSYQNLPLYATTQFLTPVTLPDLLSLPHPESMPFSPPECFTSETQLYYLSQQLKAAKILLISELEYLIGF